jgi:hypothetical protein
MDSVIPRLDRGIQSFHRFLDPPVKPEDDKMRLNVKTLNIKDDRYIRRNNCKKFYVTRHLRSWSCLRIRVLAIKFNWSTKPLYRSEGEE